MNNILSSDLFVDEIKETAVFLGSLFLNNLLSHFVVLEYVLPPCPFVFSLSNRHGELLNMLQSGTLRILV